MASAGLVLGCQCQSSSRGSAPAAATPEPLPPLPLQAAGDASAPSNFTPKTSGLLLGYNLDFPGDWTNQPPFIDLMKNSRPLQGNCEQEGCDRAAHLDLDTQGWPKSLRYRDDPSQQYSAIETFLNTSEERYDLGKRFIATWEGEGEVEVEVFGGEVREVGPRRLEFRLPTTLLLRLRPERSGLRNVRVFRAEHEELLKAGQVFNPDFLAFLQPFRSLRFMDWMQSNAPGVCSGGPRHAEECYPLSEQSCGEGRCVVPGRFAERPTPDRRSWASWAQFLDPAAPQRGTRVGGYPLEVMLRLANEAHASPHFNMPALFDAEYVTAFASQVRRDLDPSLVARVEYSNEVWNWAFPQANYAKARADKMMPGEGSGWVQFMAGRTRRMCELWKQAFAGQEHRLVCLISPQTGWRELVEDVLDCRDWRRANPGAGPCSDGVDAINISGYFSGCLPDRPDEVRSWLRRGQAAALDRAFKQLEHGGELDDCVDNLDHTIETYSFFKKLAARRGLDLVVYEGGTHFEYPTENPDDPVLQLLVAMTRDPRMYHAYQRNWRGFEATGGQSFNLWGWITKDDPWANAETLLDRSHMKYRAAMQFMTP